jgi:hypothetical protein
MKRKTQLKRKIKTRMHKPRTRKEKKNRKKKTPQ